MGRPASEADDMMEAREKCGVFGARSAEGVDVIPGVLRGLEALQHRGQESWGIAAPGKQAFRRMGLVTNHLEFGKQLSAYTGASGIGHVRYSTSGGSNLRNAQPVEIASDFWLAHNGTLVNAQQFEKPVSEEFGEDCDTDTRTAGYRLLHFLRQENDMFHAFQRLSNEIAGAYCFVILDRNGEVFAARDPRGYRPLCLGWHDESKTYIVASENCALTAVGAAFVRDVEPGEMVRLGGPGRDIEAFRFAPKVTPAHCAFEYTYFAHPSSKINGVGVYEARKRVGKTLAKKFKMQGEVVIPVPDSARPAALGYSVESGIPMDEGLMKDRYGRKGRVRSFIEPTQPGREDVVKRIIPVRETIEGKDVVVIDDSVVRGTSAKIIVKALRSAGAKKVRMAVTFPAIKHPCYMGIDFPSKEELLAHRVAGDVAGSEETAGAVGKEIGVDEFVYNDVESLSEAIGLPKDSLCFACVNGDYSKLGIIPELKPEQELKG